MNRYWSLLERPRAPIATRALKSLLVTGCPPPGPWLPHGDSWREPGSVMEAEADIGGATLPPRGLALQNQCHFSVLD